MTEIVMIAAVARNGVIGADNDMPWRLPSDLKHFKSKTIGRPVIMGRKTFQSLGRALLGRPNLIVTRDKDFQADGAEVRTSLSEAIDRAREHARDLGVDEIIIMGGGQIYAELMDRADRLEITEVQAEPDGDTRFPEISEADWEEVSRVDGARSDRDSADFAFVTYRRRSR